MKECLIGCDNAGVDLKRQIVRFLKEKGETVVDIGVNSEDDDTPYPEIARRAAELIIGSGYSKQGILICGTGIGMAITANKFPGVYAALCHDGYSAERARLSNDANIITMGARVIGPELAKSIVATWFALEFKPGRSSDKLALLKKFERDNFSASQR